MADDLATNQYVLVNEGGVADTRLSLFRNPASAPYWAGRSAAVFEMQAGNSRIYTAPASDWYGVVVFNNAQGPPSTGYYALRVEDAPVGFFVTEDPPRASIVPCVELVRRGRLGDSAGD